VIGDRAYIATPQNSGRWFTNLRLFDVSDPTAPLEIATTEPGSSQIFKAPPAFWLGLPVDVTSEELSVLTGGNVVAVATNPLTYPYHASNVRLYDVTDDNLWRWIGAVSLGREPTDGMIRRIRLKGPTLYAITAGIGKGLQVVDLEMATDIFDTATAGGEQSLGYWQMQGGLNSTSGFAQEAIVQTIHVPTGTGDNSQLWDLAVTELSIFGMTQTGMIATGRSPLVIASQTEGLIYNGPITDGEGGEPLTSWGFGVAAGTVAGVPIAVVSAIGGAGPTSGTHVLAIVDLTNPFAPRALSILPLPGTASGVQDVVLRDTTVYIGTNAGTLVVSVADPNNPRLTGTIPGVSGRLAFSGDAILLGTRRALTETTNAAGGLRSAALDTVVVVDVETDYLLINESNTSVDDLGIRLRVIPTADGVINEGLLIRNESGTTIFSQDLTPAQVTSLVWPKGQPLLPEPQHIALEVRGSDGQRSRPVSANRSTAVLPPELASVEPQRLNRTTNDTTVRLRGKRFSGQSRAILLDTSGEEIELETDFKSSVSLDVIVPGTVLGDVGELSIVVTNGALRSTARSLKVVMPTNVAVPHLTSVTPQQIVAGSEGEWLTVTGSGFVPGDTILGLDSALAPLTTQVLSGNELRALLPPGFLQMPTTLKLRAMTSVDPDLTSDEIDINVVGVVVAGDYPPSVDGVVEDRIPLMRATGETTRQVTLVGSNFDQGDQIFVSVDHAPFRPLATTVESATQIRAVLPLEYWRERYVEIVGQITTASGVQEGVKFVRRVQPSVSIGRAEVIPTRFASAGRYLVDSRSGEHLGSGNSFKNNPEGFRLEVTDPSRPDITDPNKASVRLESVSTIGVAFDEIPRVEMQPFQGTSASSKSRGDWIVAVTDGVDDGRVQATNSNGTTRFGGGRDGDPKDPTIESRLGGHLQVSYRNVEKNITIGPVQIPVGTERRRLRVRAYKVTDSTGASKWTDDDIRAALRTSAAGAISGPTAADIWASASVELVQLTHDAISDIRTITPSSAAMRWNTPEMASCVIVNQTTRERHCFLTNDYQGLIAQRSATDAVDNVISMFFVDHFETVNAQTGARTRGGAFGQAIIDIGFMANATTPLPTSSSGAVFIARDAISGGTLAMSNAKTVAHELAHVVFSNDPNQRMGGGDDNIDFGASVNVLNGSPDGALGLKKKRFNEGQIANIIGKSRFTQR